MHVDALSVLSCKKEFESICRIYRKGHENTMVNDRGEMESPAMKIERCNYHHPGKK